MKKCAYLRRYESLGDIFELVKLKQYQKHFGHAEGFWAHTLPPVDIYMFIFSGGEDFMKFYSHSISVHILQLLFLCISAILMSVKYSVADSLMNDMMSNE